ncbi:MAG: class I SAM-dependent methyltransferase [Planctomycetota bacterium]
MTRGKVYEQVEARARRHDPEDFWGQTGRSVRGVPVGEDQIELLIDAVAQGLNLVADDLLLDVCCGNGALSTRCFQRCRGGVGVDFSDYLIGVAKKNFESPPQQTYVLGDVVEFARSEVDPLRFTKALCYGSFTYLSRDSAHELLSTVRQRFGGIRRFFVGNLPDKALMSAFLDPGANVSGIEDDPESPIGIWRTVEEFTDLANSTGWQPEFRRMPASYYAAHYRYDVVLTQR